MSLALNPNQSERPLFEALCDLSTAYDENQFNAHFANVFHSATCRCEHCVKDDDGVTQ